jgi:hypothetical protein
MLTYIRPLKSDYSLNGYCKIYVFPFKIRFNCNSENKSWINIFVLCPFVSGIFHWYKYCKQSKSLCLKTLFSSILSWHDQKKHKNIKGAYLIHCYFGRKTLIKSKQIHFYSMCFWSDLNMNLSLSELEVTEFVKAKTPGLKRFIPKSIRSHIH